MILSSSCASCSQMLSLDAARRRDPTGTADLSARLSAELTSRWRVVSRLTLQMMTADVLGMRAVTPQLSSADPVAAFQAWFDAALSRVVVGIDGRWIAPYVEEAVARARRRAHRLVSYAGTDRRETSVTALVSATVAEVQGVCEAVSQQAVRAVKDGVLVQEAPRRVAGRIQSRIVGVGVVRSRALARTAIVEAFSHATLDALQALGVRRVGVEAETVRRAPPPVTRDAAPNLVEVLTAGDDLVCQQCEDISDDGPYEIEEARGLIPAHPYCRCAFVPANDARFASVRS